MKDLLENLQPTCNQLATDCISRQAAIYAVGQLGGILLSPYLTGGKKVVLVNLSDVLRTLESLPSAQPTQNNDSNALNTLEKMNKL